LSLNEKQHNIDFPTFKLPTSTKNLLFLIILVYDY